MERTAQRLVLRSGATTLVLDREAQKAVMQRKLLFWNLKPAEVPISELIDVAVDTSVDRASGVEMCSTMLVMRSGAAWAFPAADKKEARANADAIRSLLKMSLSPPASKRPEQLLRGAKSE